MKNESGLHPRGSKLLLYPDPIMVETQSGIVVATGKEVDRLEMAQTEGVVVEIGPNAYHDQVSPWCKVGERVIFAKYAGIMSKGKDGKQYRFVNDLDIVGVIDE